MRNLPFAIAIAFCFGSFTACSRYGSENGDDCSPGGTYDVVYTPETVLVEFPKDSPVETENSQQSFIAAMGVPCDQSHIAREPPYDWTEPESFNDVLTFSVDGEEITAASRDGTSYLGTLMVCEANLEASVSLPQTSEGLCNELVGCPDTKGTATLTIEFTKDSMNALLEYDLIIDNGGLRLALCSATYNGIGILR